MLRGARVKQANAACITAQDPCDRSGTIQVCSNYDSHKVCTAAKCLLSVDSAEVHNQSEQSQMAAYPKSLKISYVKTAQ